MCVHRRILKQRKINRLLLSIGRDSHHYTIDGIQFHQLVSGYHLKPAHKTNACFVLLFVCLFWFLLLFGGQAMVMPALQWASAFSGFPENVETEVGGLNVSVYLTHPRPATHQNLCARFLLKQTEASPVITGRSFCNEWGCC